MADQAQLTTGRLPVGFTTQQYPNQSGVSTTEDVRLVNRNPAPNATQPLVPNSPTVIVKISS